VFTDLAVVPLAIANHFTALLDLKQKEINESSNMEGHVPAVWTVPEIMQVLQEGCRVRVDFSGLAPESAGGGGGGGGGAVAADMKFT
jgi:hypothetical protein